jgi:hypothetical protein
VEFLRDLFEMVYLFRREFVTDPFAPVTAAHGMKGKAELLKFALPSRALRYLDPSH